MYTFHGFSFDYRNQFQTRGTRLSVKKLMLDFRKLCGRGLLVLWGSFQLSWFFSDNRSNKYKFPWKCSMFLIITYNFIKTSWAKNFSVISLYNFCRVSWTIQSLRSLLKYSCRLSSLSGVTEGATLVCCRGRGCKSEQRELINIWHRLKVFTEPLAQFVNGFYCLNRTIYGLGFFQVSIPKSLFHNN